jgi:hypothetical protein
MPNATDNDAQRAGGAATAAGMDFQHRVAAWLAVRILGEQCVAPLWGWHSQSTLDFVRCGTEQPVDDIMVGESGGGIALIQVKHSVSLERNPDSPFGGTIDQLVRQFLRPNGTSPGRPRWERPLDCSRDRLVLIVGPGSSDRVVSTLPTILGRARSLVGTQLLAETAKSVNEREVFVTVRNHVEAAWLNTVKAAPTEAQLRQFLTCVWIERVDADQQGVAEREAKELLRQAVLWDPAEADAAWDVLVQACAGFARDHSGANRTQLQQLLSRKGLDIHSPRSYREDVQRLMAYSRETVHALASLAEIRVGQGALVRIQRSSTLALKAKAEAGSLLVIGEPGAGKSGALHDLAAVLQDAGHDVLLLAADRLQSSSLAALRGELQLGRDLLDIIENWHGKGKAFFITDALDAARSDHAGQMLRELIGRVLRFSGRWQVVASIRKFDLRHNRDLRLLFPGDAPDDYHDPHFVGTNHFQIPLLDSAELAQVCAQSPPMRRLIETIQAGSNHELRELIRFPFNLRLLGELVGEGLPVEALTPIRTQIELLNRYWEARVIRQDHGGDAREAVLRIAASRMVGARSLRVARSQVSNDANSGATLDELLSAGLLQEYPGGPAGAVDRDTLSFAHHLLFDFAVARLLLRGPSADLVQTVSNDPELVVAFRPSFALHFQHIWETDISNRSGFWDLVFRFNEAPGIPLIGRIIGASVAVELAERIEDFEPLLADFGGSGARAAGKGAALDAVGHIIGALMARGVAGRLLTGPSAQPWCAFAEQLSHFVGLVAYPVRQLLTTLCERPQGFTPDQRKSANTAARNLLSYAWTEQPGYDPALARGGIEVVCRTFGGEPAASAILLNQALESNRVQQHGHEELYALANELLMVLPYDASLVETLYRTAFEQHRDSGDTTSLGPPSQILGFLSNVGQDWQQVLWLLSERYQAFLEHAPVAATRGLVAALTAWIARKHRPRSGKSFQESFQFRGLTCTIRTDYSAIWDSQSSHGGDFVRKMTDVWEDYLRGLSADRGVLIGEIVGVVAQYNIDAMLWRRLLLIGARSPLTLGAELRELLWQMPVLTCIDTTEPVGQLANAVFARLSPAERTLIEQRILAIPPHAGSEGHARTLKCDRLLGCLPPEALVTQEAKELRKQMEHSGGPPPNLPLFTIGLVGFSPLTTEDHLQDLGVPVQEPANQHLISLIDALRSFCGTHTNDAPTPEQVGEVLPVLLRLREALRTAEMDGVHPKQRDYAWGYLVEASARVARQSRLSPQDESGSLIRGILLDAAAQCEPQEVLQTSDSFDEFPSWGSPAPLVDAAEGLLLLALHPTLWDQRILDAVRRLRRAAEPAVRLEVATNLHLLFRTNPDLMWELYGSFAKDEPSRAVLLHLTSSLSRLAGNQPVEVLALVGQIFRRITPGPGAKAVRDACVDAFINLFLWQGIPACKEEVMRIATAPWQQAEDAMELVVQLRDNLTCGRVDLPDPVDELVRQRALSVTERLLAAATQELSRITARYKGCQSADVPPELQERVKSLHELIDAASSQLYIASGALDLKQNKPEVALDTARRRRFLLEAGALLDLLATVGVARVAYHLAETLESLLEFDPAGVFLRIRNVVVNATQGGFQYESLAADVVVRTVERFLSEYSFVLRESAACRSALVEILDTFVRVGWPAAWRLTYRLDERFR